MADDGPDVGADFDIRATTYSRNQWHRTYAEGLVTHAPIATGDRVLDVNAIQVVHSGVSGNNGGYHTNPTFLEALPNEDPS